MVAATMTTSDAAPVKSDIAFGNPNDPPQGAYFADVSLSEWVARTPPAMVAQHLNVSEATIAKFPKDKPEVMPA
jgi:hypothetical protein